MIFQQEHSTSGHTRNVSDSQNFSPSDSLDDDAASKAASKIQVREKNKKAEEEEGKREGEWI